MHAWATDAKNKVVPFPSDSAKAAKAPLASAVIQASKTRKPPSPKKVDKASKGRQEQAGSNDESSSDEEALDSTPWRSEKQHGERTQNKTAKAKPTTSRPHATRGSLIVHPSTHATEATKRGSDRRGKKGVKGPTPAKHKKRPEPRWSQDDPPHQQQQEEENEEAEEVFVQGVGWSAEEGDEKVTGNPIWTAQHGHSNTGDWAQVGGAGAGGDNQEGWISPREEPAGQDPAPTDPLNASDRTNIGENEGEGQEDDEEEEQDDPLGFLTFRENQTGLLTFAQAGGSNPRVNG